MSYAAAAALQAAVFQHLTADGTLSGLVGDHVFDAAPRGEVPPLYVTLGPERALDRSDMTDHAALHVFMVSVVADTAGFQVAKQVAAAVSDALVDARPVLDRGRVVRLDFRKANARRVGNGVRRRIDLTFAALVEAN